VVAGPPPGEVQVPAAVSELAAGRVVRAVWLNELGGTTFEIGGGNDRCFLKWAPAGSGLDLAVEADRLGWVAPFARAQSPRHRSRRHRCLVGHVTGSG
jgi:kanamycin kinase